MGVLIGTGVVLLTVSVAWCGFAVCLGPRSGPVCEGELSLEIEEEKRAAVQVKERVNAQHRKAS